MVNEFSIQNLIPMLPCMAVRDLRAILYINLRPPEIPSSHAIFSGQKNYIKVEIRTLSNILYYRGLFPYLDEIETWLVSTIE